MMRDYLSLLKEKNQKKTHLKVTDETDKSTSVRLVSSAQVQKKLIFSGNENGLEESGHSGSMRDQGKIPFTGAAKTVKTFDLENILEFIEERAAILEYDADLPRPAAEAEAFRRAILKFRLNEVYGNPPVQGGGTVIGRPGESPEGLMNALRARYGDRLLYCSTPGAPPPYIGKTCQQCHHWRRDTIGDGSGLGACLAGDKRLHWPRQDACNKFEEVIND